MKKATQFGILIAFIVCAVHAYAVPAFSRQTGLSCKVCHSNPPELTPFGRDFKLRGYLLNNFVVKDREDKDPWLTKYFPISVQILLSDTATQKAQPGSQNNTAGFPQQLSLFFAGGYANHFGGLAQITYDHASDHFTMDNTDLRFSNEGKLAGKDWIYGVTLNNNPTVEDVWNSTPAWGFPYIFSESAPGPITTPIINGPLAQDVAGIGGFSMWNNHLYTCFSVYRSEHAGSPVPVTGAGSPYNISGVAPYWRAGWQQTWGSNYLEVGTYGIYVNTFPGAITGPEDRYVDPAIDFQYEHPFGPNSIDAHGTIIFEKANLGATYAAGGASQAKNNLTTYKLDSTFHWTSRYAATAALFSTTGTADSLLYAAAPLTGSNNAHPNTDGYILQAAYWPIQNVDINLSYTGYLKFNGASSNYDGAGRSATANNTVYIALWLLF